MGENLIIFYRKNIKQTWKIAFYTTFISFLLIHIYKFTNTLLNHDSLYNVYSNQDMTISGRWFLQYACGISSYFDLPWINGLLCAVYLGFSTAVITELFDMHNPIVIALSGLILASCPSTTETLFFEYTADGYLLGLFLSALAACISCKAKKTSDYAISAVCLCLSCAIYQAYVSFAVVLCICYLVLRLLNHEITVWDSWVWIGKHILTYGIALCVYYAIWKFMLFLSGVVPTDYQGISQAGNITLSTLLSGVVKSVRNILFYYLEWNILEHPITLYAALNIAFILALGGILIAALVKSGTHKEISRFLMIIFCLVACIPIISLWNFVSDGVTYRTMMLHSICIFYILALILFDKWLNPKLSTVFGLLVAVMVFNFSIMANISYFYLNSCYEKSYYTGSQMMERISQAKCEEKITSIAFIGSRDVDIADDFPAYKIHHLATLIKSEFLFDQRYSYPFLKHVMGLDIPENPPSEQIYLLHNQVVQNMGIWPSEDSVAVIDGVLVIKLGEIP